MMRKCNAIKEAFVEDYQIGLNSSYQRGIFELPNAYTYLFDFQNPRVLEAGVSTEKSIEKQGVQSKAYPRTAYSEPERLDIIEEMSQYLDFSPNKSAKPDHQAVLSRLKARQEF